MEPKWILALSAIASIATIATAAYMMWPKTTAVQVVSTSEYDYYSHMCGDTRCY
jgi:hypothetical protein